MRVLHSITSKIISTARSLLTTILC